MTGLELPENLGISSGRNASVARLKESGDVDVVVNLDDDGMLISPDVFTRLVELYGSDPRLGIVVEFTDC